MKLKKINKKRMKELLLFAIFSISTFVFVQGQTTVSLQIHHRLGAKQFSLQSTARNNLNEEFIATRLEYYISDISVIHDGGQETAFKNLWILVNANNETVVELGNGGIEIVEGIRFFVGVGPDYNHLDPASYPADHPLAPQWPSMHWGWVSGYRFVAFEGFGGSAFNQIFQLHGLGDANYFETFVDVSAVAVDGKCKIEIDGDYERALEDISVASGVISHGEDMEAKQTLENFSQYVFSSHEPLVAVGGLPEASILGMELFPNPVCLNDRASLVVTTSGDKNYGMVVRDLSGRVVCEVANGYQSNQTGYLPNIGVPGLYFVQLMDESHIVSTSKLLVK